MKDGDVLRLNDKGYSRLYPCQIDTRDIILVTTLRNRTDRKILANLGKVESMSNEQLRRITQLAKSTLSEHLTRLVSIRIVKTSQNVGGPTAYSLSDPDRVRAAFGQQPFGALAKAADRFVELWDF